MCGSDFYSPLNRDLGFRDAAAGELSAHRVAGDSHGAVDAANGVELPHSSLGPAHCEFGVAHPHQFNVLSHCATLSDRVSESRRDLSR